MAEENREMYFEIKGLMPIGRLDEYVSFIKTLSCSNTMMRRATVSDIKRLGGD